MEIALFIVIAILVMICAAGAYVFVVACVRRKETPWLDSTKVLETPDGKYYEFMRDTDAWLDDHNAIDVCVKSSDGLLLHGLFVQKENAIGTVLLAHGYRSTHLLDFSAAIPCFYELGFNLLIPNQRAHGNSQGKYITFGIKESTDMEKWIEYHNKEIDTCPILLFGISMGASTLLYLADRELPENVRGIIADCGFTSPYAIIRGVFQRATWLSGKITLFATNIFSVIFAGFRLKEKDTVDVLSRSRYPVLMIHGTGDDYVPCEMSKKGFAACAEPKTLMLVEGAGHGVSFFKDSERYIETVKDFIEKYIINR